MINDSIVLFWIVVVIFLGWLSHKLFQKYHEADDEPSYLIIGSFVSSMLVIAIIMLIAIISKIFS